MPPPPSPSSSLPPFAVSRERLRAWGGTRPLQGDAALLRDGLHSLRLLLLKSLLTRAEREAPAAALARVHGDWALLERAEARDAAAVRDALGLPADPRMTIDIDWDGTDFRGTYCVRTGDPAAVHVDFSLIEVDHDGPFT
ncbi:hypothetical protein HLB32_34990, partial [Streptomyces cacaoi]|nr:hypothetical protein [Streptomyces cacaoi]